MNKKYLIGGAALAAVALVLYARSKSGAESKNTVVKYARSYLPASWLDKASAAPAATTTTDAAASTVRASDTPESE